MEKTPLQRAVEIIGGQSATARLLGVTQPAVRYWLKVTGVPAKHVVRLEKASKISRTELRPDIFYR